MYELIISYFEPKSIEKILWVSGFSNFGHVTIFAKQKFGFLAAILKWNIFLMFFLLICGCLRCIHMSFICKILRVST